MKYTFTVLAMSLAVLTMTACMDRYSSTPPGEYQHSSSSVDAKGTKRTSDSKTEVYYDEYGNKKVKSDTTTTTDPKGLFNKSTTEQSDVIR